MENEKSKIEELFARNVFTMAKMKERLPAKVYSAVEKVCASGGDLTRAQADAVAKAMKDWAIENGATHYSHWFQPLNGTTAEKHDAFLTPGAEDGSYVLQLSGKDLLRGEPDASSFPSGGLRSTFEARGYTAWDITSPAFLKEASTGKILCIPTVFYSYTGEALDKKAPLLQSMEIISAQTVRLLRILGNKKVKKVTPQVGVEQEYFLVDAGNYMKRADLKYSGHTLFGAPATKGQALDDHYFGVIRERVGSFMRDLNFELWKLGVPAKTQHNEVPPGQHELAPIYENANIALDHNQLVMETMKRVAVQHGLRCLLHEKPYAGVNGSGKHNNWSLLTDEGENLLDPGESPERNIQFLLILASVLRAVDLHADLLRQSVSDPGNDLRLGGFEAPPAIISVFLGAQLDDVMRQLIETGRAKGHIKGGKLRTGISTLQDIDKDATDRNRTSPFAFTGNKFEFRMVGSSDSIGEPVTVINTIVAETLSDVCDRLEKAKDIETEVHDIIKEFFTEHERIVFNGNGYAKEWVKEAERRGLPNYRTMAEAAAALTAPASVKLYEKFGIYSRAELESRQEIQYDTYAKTVHIDALTMIEMAGKQIIPGCMQYEKELAQTVLALREAGEVVDTETRRLKQVASHIEDAQNALEKLTKQCAKGAEITDAKKRAFYYQDTIKPTMAKLRAPCDALEMLVDERMWPFPTYGDLMFEV
ncbi:MAG: glutamine synthetase III [Lachnospiraceae bacterium]|nr:glutamine synthetase III [Lachnospiraceae bacterium]